MLYDNSEAIVSVAHHAISFSTTQM
uniref:Uncharacterized protein n=1 Tax=Rhizophora mucronata TaxID=61149 RepID=A0A2P2QCD8_RHIMU